MKRFAKYKLIPLKTPLYERLQVILTYLFQKGGMGGFAIPPLSTHNYKNKSLLNYFLYFCLVKNHYLPSRVSLGSNK